MVPAEAFPATEAKIDNAFAAGYGTVLYYEDESVVEGLQNAFPLYSSTPRQCINLLSGQRWNKLVSAHHFNIIIR